MNETAAGKVKRLVIDKLLNERSRIIKNLKVVSESPEKISFSPLSLKIISASKKLVTDSILAGAKIEAAFVHGSGAKGNAKKSPHIVETSYYKNGIYVKSLFRWVGPLYDDADLCLITPSLTSTSELVRQIAEETNRRSGIEFTVNLFSNQELEKQITDFSNSPALRRVLLFTPIITLHNPKLINEKVDMALKAFEKTHVLDYLQETDFRTLMRIASTLYNTGHDKVVFDKEEMGLLFPSTCLAREGLLFVGYPKNRKKLNIPKQIKFDRKHNV